MKHLERKEVLNIVYTRQADRMADAYARLMADFSQMTAWGRGLESDLSRARVELMLAKAEVERLTAFTTRTIIPNEELQKQVERLTKAGDAMAEIVHGTYCVEPPQALKDWNEEKMAIMMSKTIDEIASWNAAKEGKQS